MVFDGHYDVIAEEVASAPAAQPQAPSPALRPLDRLVALQRADGSWELTPELAAILGAKLKELEAFLSLPAMLPLNGDAGSGRLFATALALEFLEAACAKDRVEWLLLAGKASAFLDGALPSAALRPVLEKAAKEAVRGGA